MMKKSCKWISILCAAAMLTPTVSCGRRSEGEEVNENQTKLYIGFGFADDGYLKSIADEFEDLCKDVVFEEGKQGVQVFVDADVKYSNTETLYSNLSSYKEEIIFSEMIQLNQLISKGLVAEITDAVTTPINQNAYSTQVDLKESKSIADKMLQSYKNYYSFDGKYYALPSTESTIGIIYDVDLFTAKGYYFANAESANEYGFVDPGFAKTDLSAGPDGQAGTYDDGLPATYEEFFELCEYISVENGDTSILWGGKVQTYPVTFMTALYADYEGAEGMRLTYDFDGTANDLIDIQNGEIQFNQDGTPKLTSANITAENGYEVFRQAGRYYALQFMNELVSNDDYYNTSDCFGGTVDHLTAQSKFLLSKAKNSPVAMLFDGTWWQSEAEKSNVFKDMQEKYGDAYAKENRNFAFMPLPKATANKVGEKQTTMIYGDAFSFINANVKEEKKPLCELFLKFLHTKSSLLKYTQTTSIVRPYELDLNETELATLNSFGRSCYEIHRNTNLFVPLSHSDVFNTARHFFSPNGMQVWETTKGNQFTAMLHDGVVKSGTEHFLDIVNYRSKKNWDDMFKGVCYE